MSKFISLISLLVPCVIASGCFPCHYTECPGIYGKVVDSETRQPLAGASISFGLTNMATDAYSATNGSFDIPPQKAWGVYIFPAETFAIPFFVCVRHAGYESNCVKFYYKEKIVGKVPPTYLGLIELKPVPQ